MRFSIHLGCCALLLLHALAVKGSKAPADYAVVVSASTHAAWAQSVAALRKKHGAALVEWQKSVEEALPKLAALMPS